MSETRRYLTCAETAKEIRKALHVAFPLFKAFSVRSSVYSGGASISIRWTDGPNAHDVDAVAGHFSGASFDGMIDLKSYHDSDLNGERVHFGADYVFTYRAHKNTRPCAFETRGGCGRDAADGADLCAYHGDDGDYWK